MDVPPFITTFKRDLAIANEPAVIGQKGRLFF
mgnify:CR=1 FL=1